MPTPKQINPFFPTNGAIEDFRFVHGRDKDIKQVFECLNSGGNVAVTGDRGIGKSSLLKAICQQVKTRLDIPREPIYLNLQNINGDDEFYKTLCDLVGVEFCKGYKFIRNLQGRRLLLIIDQIENFSQNGLSHYVQCDLKGWSDQANGPTKLFFGSDISLDKVFPQLPKIIPSSLAGICFEHKLGKWDKDTARDFINSRLNCFVDTTITFEENEISELIDASEGHPQKLMESCHRLFKAKQIL
jgi:Cdc6-like AAA superfamily ATPase